MKKKENEKMSKRAPVTEVDPFPPGTKVSVRMTGLSGWENYMHCFLDGVVEGGAKKSGQGKRKPARGQFVVKLDHFRKDERVTVSKDRLELARGPEAKRKWEPGDKVHVRVVIDKLPGWWEGRIVSADKKQWKVRWEGKYAKAGQESLVHAKTIRGAKEEDEEDEEDDDEREEEEGEDVVDEDQKTQKSNE